MMTMDATMMVVILFSALVLVLSLALDLALVPALFLALALVPVRVPDELGVSGGSPRRPFPSAG